jgi:hypothetical protein
VTLRLSFLTLLLYHAASASNASHSLLPYMSIVYHVAISHDQPAFYQVLLGRKHVLEWHVFIFFFDESSSVAHFHRGYVLGTCYNPAAHLKRHSNLQRRPSIAQRAARERNSTITRDNKRITAPRMTSPRSTSSHRHRNSRLRTSLGVRNSPESIVSRCRSVRKMYCTMLTATRGRFNHIRCEIRSLGVVVFAYSKTCTESWLYTCQCRSQKHPKIIWRTKDFSVSGPWNS